MNEQNKIEPAKKDYFFFKKDSFKTFNLASHAEAFDIATADPEVHKVVCSDKSEIVYQVKTALSVLAILFSLATTALAQTFGGGITITGTTNSSVQFTNYATVTLPSEYIVLGNVSNTNEVFIGSFQAQFAGTTNLYPMGYFTNSFATGTNSGTWTTNTSRYSFQIPVAVLMQASVGTNSNTIFVYP